MHALQHHSLALEFPDYKDTIHRLKTTDTHFRRLLETYESLSKTIENIETTVTPADTHHEEDLKRQRVHLKDQLYQQLLGH